MNHGYAVETILTGYGLVEGPKVDGDDALYFSDAERGGVYRRTPEGEVETVVPRRKGVGGIALHARGGIVISGRDLSHVHQGESRTIFRDPEIPRFNDIFADAQGRLLAGSLRFDPLSTKATPEPGSLYRIDAEGAATILYDDVGLTNGIGFSPDGRVLYHSDSIRRHVIRHDVSDEGLCLNRGVLAQLPAGAPDGLCVDASGCVWVAAYGTGRAQRITPEGEIDLEIELPEARVTSLCFGGADLRDLYIVTADDGGGAPPRGSILRTRVDVAGLPAPRVRV